MIEELKKTTIDNIKKFFTDNNIDKFIIDTEYGYQPSFVEFGILHYLIDVSKSDDDSLLNLHYLNSTLSEVYLKDGKLYCYGSNYGERNFPIETRICLEDLITINNYIQKNIEPFFV